MIAHRSTLSFGNTAGIICSMRDVPASQKYESFFLKENVSILLSLKSYLKNMQLLDMNITDSVVTGEENKQNVYSKSQSHLSGPSLSGFEKVLDLVIFGHALSPKGN